MRGSHLVSALVWSVPLGVLGQMALAGLSLFEDGSLWIIHASLGFGLTFPIGALALTAFLRPSWRPLRPAASALVAAYVVQVVLATRIEDAATGIVPALHVANAGLVLLASFALALQHTASAGTRVAGTAHPTFTEKG